MEQNEREELRKKYHEMSDEEVIEIILEDEPAYKQQPYESYELLRSEAYNRGLDERIEQIKKQRQELKEKEAAADIHWVCVCRFYNEVERMAIEAALNDNEIPCEIILRYDLVYSGILKSSMGLGDVMVKAEHLEQARRIVEDVIRENKKPGGEDGN